MRSAELHAVHRARARRKRVTRQLVVMTVGTGVVTAALFLVFPGFSSRIGPAPAASITPPAAPIAPAVPVVKLRGGAILLDGVEIGRTEGIDRLRKVDPLFDALHRRRLEAPPGERRLILDVDQDTPAIVVKAVFQTAAFAGYTDVAFTLPDGGLLGARP